MDYKQLTKPYHDTKVDDLETAQGSIDILASLQLDMNDQEIIANLNNRIADSQSYWNDTKGYNLRESRNEGVRLHLGKQIDTSRLYRYQVPYIENQVFVAVEAQVAYLTSQPPQAEVYPAQDTDKSRIFSTDLEKALRAHAEKFQLNRIMEQAIRNLLLKRLGCLYLYFDPDHGPAGEIIPSSIDPEHIIIDKNAKAGQNPEFICYIRKDSVDKLCYLFPEKKDAIYRELGIVRGTPKQRSQMVAWRQVWVTHYVKGKPVEGCVSYMNKTVMGKYKDPNWLHGKGANNFLDVPMKPFIPINYVNDGSHWVDQTSPVEQASAIQHILNKRGRQIMENADTANGFMIFSNDALSKDDAQNMTGDPNQKLIIKTNGQAVNSLVMQIPPHLLPDYVQNDKIDLRNTIHSIMGTPSQFRGDDSDDKGDSTLGEAIMIKNQASGRQDLIARAVDAAMDQYFKLLTQMMKVHYTEKHYFTINGGDGAFDYVVVNRSRIEDGTQVTVKSGASLPFDKSRQEAVALNLAKMGMIDPYNLFKDLHMDNPQKRYDAWFKWKSNPEELARGAMDDLQDSKAYMDFAEIMGGKQAPPREDVTTEHILTHRKQMISDEFLKAKPDKQQMFIAHLGQEVHSLEQRTALDMQAKGGAEMLDPEVPIQPEPPAPQMGIPGPMGTPGMPPGMAPGQPTVAGVMGGAPQMGSPEQPPPMNLGNPAQMPMV